MKASHLYFYYFALLGLAVILTVPQGVDAKTVKKSKVLPRCNKGFCVASVSITAGADEKDFKNPDTRCLTAEMNKRHEDAIKQMETDVAKHGQGHEDAVKEYKEKIDILWSAMHEPYCGYGSQGMKAVKHSWDKTINNSRTAFLEATGAKKLAVR
jgi:hypothetical protein